MNSQIWHFVNTNHDDHPIHVHLVQFQVIWKRPFDVEHFKKSGKVIYTGSPMPYNPSERGWKDTVKCPPGHVTAIIIPFFPYTGQYVWHCHILEHEDYEMMRPYMVMPST